MLNSAGMEDTARERERRKKGDRRTRREREGATVGDLAVGALRPALWRPLTLIPKVPDVSRSSLPFLPLLLSPRSLSDRHTFSKIDLGSAATVTRAPLSERERERPATSNRRCRTDSVLNSCLGSLSPVFEEERERNGLFLSPPASLLLSLFLVPLPTTSLSLSLGLSTCSRLPSVLVVFHSTCLSLDLCCTDCNGM